MNGRTTLAAAVIVAAASLTQLGCPAAGPPRPATTPVAVAPRDDAVPYVERVPGTDVSFTMTPIPAGRFRMGSPATEAGRKPDEGPQVEVEMEGFYIATHEVDWAAFLAYAAGYDRVMNRGDYKPPTADRLADAVSYPSPQFDVDTGPRLQRMGGRNAGFPAVLASRFTARQYAKWVSKKTGRFYRLPTEAEWEYACRAGSTTTYSFGDDPKGLSDHGWWVENSVLKDDDEPAYRKVGTRTPNAWGLYDMHGNVGEWVTDAYDAERYAKLAARGRPVRWDEAVNLPTTRYPGVIRGGGYESEAADCRSAARFKATVLLNVSDPQDPKSVLWDNDALWVGFRLVSPAREPTEDEKRRYWGPDTDGRTAEGLRRSSQVWELIEPATRPATTTTTTKGAK